MGCTGYHEQADPKVPPSDWTILQGKELPSARFLSPARIAEPTVEAGTIRDTQEHRGILPGEHNTTQCSDGHCPCLTCPCGFYRGSILHRKHDNAASHHWRIYSELLVWARGIH